MSLRFLLIICLVSFVMSAAGQSPKFRSLLDRAREGDINAQNEVGVAYSEAIGVRPNQRRAVFWFTKAAEGGYAIGTCNLALHYGRGWGVSKSRLLMMKYVFAAHALDGLKCNPADFVEYYQHYHKPLSDCLMERSWGMALVWLRSHSDFKNDFGEKPWLDEKAEYPVTFRENAPSMNLPPKTACKPKTRSTRKE